MLQRCACFPAGRQLILFPSGTRGTRANRIALVHVHITRSRFFLPCNVSPAERRLDSYHSRRATDRFMLTTSNFKAEEYRHPWDMGELLRTPMPSVAPAFEGLYCARNQVWFFLDNVIGAEAGVESRWESEVLDQVCRTHGEYYASPGSIVKIWLGWKWILTSSARVPHDCEWSPRNEATVCNRRDIE